MNKDMNFFSDYFYKSMKLRKRRLVRHFNSLKVLKEQERAETLKTLQDEFGYVPFNFPNICIASALPIDIKKSGSFAMIPQNLDLDAHIEKYPPVNSVFFVADDSGLIKAVNRNGTVGLRFDVERMVYIIGLISSIPSRNKDLITEDGFVPIYSALIRNFFKDYFSYLCYLIETGVLICNGQFRKGKSYGFKFAPEYDSVPLVKYVYSLVRDRNVDIDPIDDSLLNLPYLSHWYFQKKLFIDENNANNYAYSLMQEKFRLGRDSWDINKDRWIDSRNDFDRKNPRVQYYAITNNITALSAHEYRAMIDDRVHRLHSVLTNMQKDFRNFLTYNGQQLVSIDIKNSQPYLLCLLFNPLFWQSTSNLPLNIQSLPDSIKNLFSIELLERIQEYAVALDIESLNSYKENVSNGIVYEYIMERVFQEIDIELTRNEAKIMMLIVFFSKNRFFHQPKAKLKRLFAGLYPEIYELIKLIKLDAHATFACLLQSIESEIILHRCCKRIWVEGNKQVPIFTIHDSIVTTIEHKDYVKKVMKEELTKIIGIPPKLSEEFWTEQNIDFSRFDS